MRHSLVIFCGIPIWDIKRVIRSPIFSHIRQIARSPLKLILIFWKVFIVSCESCFYFIGKYCLSVFSGVSLNFLANMELREKCFGYFCFLCCHQLPDNTTADFMASSRNISILHTYEYIHIMVALFISK